MNPYMPPGTYVGSPVGGLPYAAPAGLPQRPSFATGPATQPYGAFDSARESTAAQVDDLISSAVNVAEAKTAPAEAPKAATKKKTDKKTRMVYDDEEFSPEEKMARLPKYRLVLRQKPTALGHVEGAVTGAVDAAG